MNELEEECGRSGVGLEGRVLWVGAHAGEQLGMRLRWEHRSDGELPRVKTQKSWGMT